MIFISVVNSFTLYPPKKFGFPGNTGPVPSAAVPPNTGTPPLSPLIVFTRSSPPTVRPLVTMPPGRGAVHAGPNTASGHLPAAVPGASPKSKYVAL